MAVSETFQLAVGDTGPTATAIANQSAEEGQPSSALNVSTYFTAPAAGDTLTYSATLPAGLSINAQTGVISGNPDRQRLRHQPDHRHRHRRPRHGG